MTPSTCMNLIIKTTPKEQSDRQYNRPQAHVLVPTSICKEPAVQALQMPPYAVLYIVNFATL